MNFILLDVKTQSKYIIEKEYKILETNEVLVLSAIALFPNILMS